MKREWCYWITIVDVSCFPAYSATNKAGAIVESGKYLPLYRKTNGKVADRPRYLGVRLGRARLSAVALPKIGRFDTATRVR